MSSFSLRAQFISASLALLTLAGAVTAKAAGPQRMQSASTHNKITLQTPNAKDLYESLLENEAFSAIIHVGNYEVEEGFFFYLAESDSKRCRAKMNEVAAFALEAHRSLPIQSKARENIEFLGSLVLNAAAKGVCSPETSVPDELYMKNENTLNSFAAARLDIAVCQEFAVKNGGLKPELRKECLKSARGLLQNGKILLEQGFPPFDGGVSLENIDKTLPEDFLPAPVKPIKKAAPQAAQNKKPYRNP